jgi:hypothetical protein
MGVLLTGYGHGTLAQAPCSLSGSSVASYERYLQEKAFPGSSVLIYAGNSSYCSLPWPDQVSVEDVRVLFVMAAPSQNVYWTGAGLCNETKLFNEDGSRISYQFPDRELTRNELLLGTFVSHFHRRMRTLFGSDRDDLLSFGLSIRDSCDIPSPFAQDTIGPHSAAEVIFPDWYLHQECPIDELLLFMFLHEAAHLTAVVGQSDEFGADDWAARVGLPFYFGDAWTPSFAMAFYEALGEQFRQMMSSLFTHDTWFMPMCYYGSLECRVDHIKGRYLITDNGDIAECLPEYCYPVENIGKFCMCDIKSGPQFRSPENRLNISCSNSCTDELENCVSNHMRNSSAGRELAKLWCVLPTMAERLDDPCRRFPELCHTKADRRQVNKFMRRYRRLIGSANTVRERMGTLSEGKKPLKYQ